MKRGLPLVVASMTLATGATGSGASPPVAIGAEHVIDLTANPDSFTFAPDGRIFYQLRLTGEIHVYDPDTGSDTLFFTVPDLMTIFDQGLLGIALHPVYPTRPWVYVYATRDIAGEARNQILRIREVGGVGQDFQVIFDTNTIAETAHQGGRILFGPDQRLYAMVGYGLRYFNAQDLTVTAGKILRLNDRGKAARGNPFPGSPIFAYGLRNSFGFAFDPETDLMWLTDNGPACNDELNLVRSGMNYGWGPTQSCLEPPLPPENTNQDGPDPVFPLLWYSPPLGITGAAFCSGCGLVDSEGALFTGAFNTGEVRRIVLTANRREIKSEEVVYTHLGAIISMERGPDGRLYFSTGDGIWRLIDR